MLGCNAPELHKPGGPEAKAFAEALLEQADQVSVFVPLPNEGADELLRSVLSFDRDCPIMLGVVYLDSQTTLSEHLVRAGHAKAA